MSDYENLLRAVLAEPGEDAPRLVFADWLEENEEGERAQFIRLSLELAREEKRLEVLQCRRPNAAKDDVLVKCQATVLCNRAWLSGTLKRRARSWMTRDLGVLHAYSQWFHESPLSVWLCIDPQEHGTNSGRSAQYTFRRGFPEVLRLPSALWLSHAAKLTATCPIREVWLTDEPPHYDGDIMAHIVPQYTPRFDMQAFRRDYGRYQLTRNWPKIAFHFPERSGVTIDPIHPDPDDERLFRPTRPLSTRRR